ncbi:MAG: pyridoxamine 5'-phosphate oxidase family protein [Actinomycetota bacterium]|nr:pyridoxamine 5'-phosphate oxidase family protein [Actinomycetota bacterium]
MHESAQEIEELQKLLDRSYTGGGVHLRRVITPARRVTAEELVQRLTGMRLLVLATVTADGRPIVGPVDGVLYRGSFHFGSAPDSVRFRHIRARPHVSATHLPEEEFAVTVHGRAVEVDVRATEGAGLRKALLDIYTPRYGPEWEAFLDGGPGENDAPVYARIEAEKMFTFHMA